MYAELTGDGKKRRIKSPRDNTIVVEGRLCFDAFVLANKVDALWYQGPALS